MVVERIRNLPGLAVGFCQCMPIKIMTFHHHIEAMWMSERENGSLIHTHKQTHTIVSHKCPSVCFDCLWLFGLSYSWSWSLSDCTHTYTQSGPTIQHYNVCLYVREIHTRTYTYVTFIHCNPNVHSNYNKRDNFVNVGNTWCSGVNYYYN